MKLPKLILTDIDGVWTDGGMYYDQMVMNGKNSILQTVQGCCFVKKQVFRLE